MTGENRGIYVVSKIGYAPMWKQLRKDGADIISSWIDETQETPEFKEAWPRYLSEVVRSSAVIVYLGGHAGEELKGGILEIGAALGAGIPVWVIGDIAYVPALKTARFHPLIHRVPWNDSITLLAQTLTLANPYSKGDAQRLDWLAANEATLTSHRERMSDGSYGIWWNVVKRRKSISGHPMGSVRSAIDAAMERKPSCQK